MDKDVQKIFRPSLRNKFLVEIVGTFILVYAIASAATVYSDSGQLGVIGIGLVHALVLTAIVYAIGYRSGAQVNPAVTIGLLVAKKIGRKGGCSVYNCSDYWCRACRCSCIFNLWFPNVSKCNITFR